MWFIVIGIVALLFAIKVAFPALFRAIVSAWKNRGDLKAKAAAKRQLAIDGAEGGMAPTATMAGETLGDAAAAVISGTRLAFTAFLRAWKAGWHEGEGRAKERRDRHAAPAATGEADVGADEPDPPPAETETVEPPLVRPCGGWARRGAPGKPIRCTNDAEPGRLYCPECKARRKEEMASAKDDTTTEGVKPMPIETSSRGEIVTYDQFIAELDSAIVEARAEREDADVQLRTAEENLQRAELMANALAKLNLPKDVVDAVKGTKDSLASQVKAAQDRMAAADFAITQLTIALNAATNNPQRNFYRG